MFIYQINWLQVYDVYKYQDSELPHLPSPQLTPNLPITHWLDYSSCPW